MAVERRKRLSRAHGANDANAGKFFLKAAGVTVGHAAHAKNAIGREDADGAGKPGREPVEVKIERLECTLDDVVQPGGKCAAGTEGKQHGIEAGGGESARQEDRLALGSAAAQIVLENENFHC